MLQGSAVDYLEHCLSTMLLAGLTDGADYRRLVLQTAHAETVTATPIDPQGECMATGGEDGVIRLWTCRMVTVCIP